jgi:dolichyl-phosphate beta-glucosyltransferase
VQFSLIIPSYNNSSELAKELPMLLQYFSSKGLLPEIIIVNDGSMQVDELRKFCNGNDFILLDYSQNMGKGAAVRNGMLHAKNEICIFTDADIPFQYEIFEDIISQFRNAEIQVVCGTRLSSSYFSKTPWVRRLGSSIFSGAVNFIMMQNMGDTQCGIKAFKQSIVQQVFGKATVNGFAADIEWIYLAKKLGYKINWVNAEFRNAGESSVVFWKQALKMLKDVFKLRWRILFTRAYD